MGVEDAKDIVFAKICIGETARLVCDEGTGKALT